MQVSTENIKAVDFISLMVVIHEREYHDNGQGVYPVSASWFLFLPVRCVRGSGGMKRRQYVISPRAVCLKALARGISKERL